MAEQSVVPELVLVSSAARAQSTCAEVLAGLATGVDPRVRVLDGLYDADADDVLSACAHEVAATTSTVLVIGHNPTIAETAELLQAERERVDLSFPTAAYAVFGLDSEWADVGPGAGAFLDSFAPDV
jgi:phosphohistidine phosphatase